MLKQLKSLFGNRKIEKAVTLEDNRPGLEVKFSCEEMIPLKNIWFKVTKVNKASLELSPISTTAKFRKNK